MSRRPPSVVMAFVDTLTCGLSAFLMLWLALVAVPAPKTGAGLPGKEAVIAVTEPAGANVSLCFEINGKLLRLHEVETATQGNIRPDDPTEGLQSYTLTFPNTYRPGEDDLVYIHLHDLGGHRPETDVTITATLGEKQVLKGNLNLLRGPAVAVRLADLLEGRAATPTVIR